MPVLLKNGAPVDKSTLAKAIDIFGKENIFDITIKNMERLKRYDVTGVTFKDQFDKAVQDVYSNVTDEIFSKNGWWIGMSGLLNNPNLKKQPKTDPLDRGQDIKPKNTFTDDLKSNNGKPSKLGKALQILLLLC